MFLYYVCFCKSIEIENSFIFGYLMLPSVVLDEDERELPDFSVTTGPSPLPAESRPPSPRTGPEEPRSVAMWSLFCRSNEFDAVSIFVVKAVVSSSRTVL